MSIWLSNSDNPHDIRYMRTLWSILFAAALFWSSALAQIDRTFKVGVILPLTGAVAEYGAAARNGFELAQQEHAELFKNLDFLVDDSQYDSKKAIASYQHFKTAGDVSLVYLWGYGPSQALAPIAEGDKFPLVAVSGDRSLSGDKKYVLRFANYNELSSLVLLEYLRAQHFSKLGIVKTELAFMNAIVEGIKAHLRAGETLEVVDAFDPSDSDFKTSLVKLKRRQFDALGVFLISGQVSQFYRQARQLGFAATTFGTDTFDSLKEIQDAQNEMNGSVFVAPFVDPAFTERYIKRYGNDLQVAYAANGYEFAVLMGRLFGNAASRPSADEVMHSLNNTEVKPAGAAIYEYDSSEIGRGFNFKVVMKKVENDRIVNIAQ